MINNKNIKFYLVLLIFLFVFSYFFHSKKDDTKQEVIVSLRDYILSSFLSELPEINKNLPHKIDKETTLVSIKFEKNKILSFYELTSNSISRQTLERIEPAIKKQVCEDETKSKLLGVDVDFLNRYQNSNGDLIFEVLVSKTTCSKF
jgi:hypothetical protein